MIYTVARKFGRTTVKGLELRTVKDNRAILYNTKGDGYDKVKKTLDEYKLYSENKVNYRVIGKSIEVVSDDVFDVLSKFNFVSEDMNDFVSAFNELKIKPLSLNLDEKAVIIKIDLSDEEKKIFQEKSEKYDIGMILM